MPAVSNAIESDFDMMANRLQKVQTDVDASVVFYTNEKESSTRENNVAKIKVVVCSSSNIFSTFPPPLPVWSILPMLYG